MTLETKLRFVHNWDKELALNCWVQFHDKWEKKYNGALFQTLLNGTHNQYIKRECETFRRYAQMWNYRMNLKYRHMAD